MNQHPSFYALDAHHLMPDPAVAAHAAGCAACRAHLEALRAAADPPAWLPAAGRAGTRRRALGLSLVAAAAASVALWPRHAVRDKGGMPAIRVHVKRGDEVAPFEPGARLRAGDRMRLEIAAAGYRFVSVASGGARAEVLFAGAIDPRGTTLLPVSFRVDGGDGEEILDVVLAAEPVPADAHRASGPPAGGWRRRFTFPTEKTP